MTPAEARALLERLGIDPRAKVEETKNWGPYMKWRARWGVHTRTLRRSDVADVELALRIVREDNARIIAALSPEQREALNLAKTGTDPK